MKPRGLRNNNPGNIRINSIKYQGEIQPSSDSAFKQFKAMIYGYRAIFMLLYTYQRRYGLVTTEQFINRYAPPCENNTSNYVVSVSRWSGIDSKAVVNTLSSSDMIPIVAAISRMENGVVADMTDVIAGWELFSGNF